MDQNRVLKGRYALFLMQTFSTLGFSVLYSTLILYTTEGLNLPDKMALAITASFIALNYALHVLGGYIGGKLLSYRMLFVVGMAIQALGCTVLSFPHFSTLIWGIAIFLSGAGLNVICINCMLTQLFEPDDKRRESAFLWNYSGMNLGFFIGFSVSGYFQLHHNYQTLFLLAGVGSLISFTIALFFWSYLEDKNTSFSEVNEMEKRKRGFLAGHLILGLIFLLWWLLKHSGFSNVLILILGGIVFSSFFVFAISQKTIEATRKIWAFLSLASFALIFWTLYQMAPMGLTLFYHRNVDPHLLGFQIAPQWLQNVNTILIILGGPTMSSVNRHLRLKGYKITLPFQFSLSLFLIGFGFLLLPLGIFFSNANGVSSIGWIIGCYVFQSLGELFISPIGYAMVGQLIPSKLQGIGMGTWLMVTGIAAVIGNYFSSYAIGSTGNLSPLKTNPTYAHAFLALAIVALLASLLIRILRSFFHKMIQEKELKLKDLEPAPYNASIE